MEHLHNTDLYIESTADKISALDDEYAALYNDPQRLQNHYLANQRRAHLRELALRVNAMNAYAEILAPDALPLALAPTKTPKAASKRPFQDIANALVPVPDSKPPAKKTRRERVQRSESTRVLRPRKE